MCPSSLHEELDALPSILPHGVHEKLTRAGFDAARLLRLAEGIRPVGGASSGSGFGGSDDDAKARRDERNRVAGEVTPPRADEIQELPAEGTKEREKLEALGLEAIERGELAFCVLAGGMATRMGGVVKALVEVAEGHTFLDLRLRENRLWSERAGRPVPLWLMTSDATDEPTRRALEAANAPAHVRTFVQDLGLRLTPEGRLFLDDEGHPSLYSPGHGDLVDAVRRSGLLRDFVAGGGRYVWSANLDNLGASIDPALLGCFIQAHAAGRAEVMVEVTDKDEKDKGGIPVHAQGKLQILEEFRLPRGFDASQVRVFNTNTFLVSAPALETVDIAWNWFEVEKKVEGRTAIQFERLLQELTGALDALYVRVPRIGAASRFLPVKDPAELEARRNTILEVVRSRGIL